ncbi:MAG TPA: cyclopropane-fatty-acyl-phospholipid synthase family protein [Solirubrobacteraceae bacterium]|jgi:cyclopropane-fatty-acyl-phospholipid synthase|nr:cyclopropane-fatty-acyl-phospholipid synthase family protein [Solirubrobacteraceae bacterium]
MTTRLSRAIAHVFLRRIRAGSLTIVEDGRRLTFGEGAPAATVYVRSPRAWRKLLRGSNGLAEAYARRLWDSPDLTRVVRVAARNAGGLDRLRSSLAPLLVPLQRVRGLLSRNTRSRRRRDIAAHYDLGNDLFELMLDPTMTYSCALFERPEMTLQQAAVAKLERVCEKLELRPSDHVLEIGSGWGAFALYAARTRGCRVTTTTISLEQHRYASDQARRAGLEDRVEVLLEDYRDLRGSYDKLVSIEMIEAVGWQHFDTFFGRCSELLKPEGAMLLQAIAIEDRAYEVEKASRSFMNTYIFPNGCLPSMRVIGRSVKRRTDMAVADVEDITDHYVLTLRHWRVNFERNAERLAALGYDERFRRIWRLYLAYCEAGFIERRIRDVQLVLTKPGRAAHLSSSLANEPVLRGAAVG